MKRRWITIFFIIVLLVSMATSAQASTRINAKAAMMVDADSGQIIYEHNATKVLPVASISKILTILVIMDQIDQNQYDGDTQIKITPEVAQIADDSAYSNIRLLAGQSYSVRELINAALVRSADGATIALATATGRGIDEFNILMEQKANEIGIKDATIVNPVGLANGEMKDFSLQNEPNNAENKMSAQDVAKMARYLLRKQPKLLTITAQKKANFFIKKNDVQVVANLNKMVTDKKYQVAGVKINGLKTGTSPTAGACLVCTGTYRGHRIITVVLNAGGKDKDNRFVETKKLFVMLKRDEHLQRVKLPASMTTVRVNHGKKDVRVTPQTVSFWEKNQEKNYSLGIQAKKLHAPIKKGQYVGSIKVTGPNIKTINNEPLTFPLYARNFVAKSYWPW